MVPCGVLPWTFLQVHPRVLADHCGDSYRSGVCVFTATRLFSRPRGTGWAGGQSEWLLQAPELLSSSFSWLSQEGRSLPREASTNGSVLKVQAATPHPRESLHPVSITEWVKLGQVLESV